MHQRLLSIILGMNNSPVYLYLDHFVQMALETKVQSVVKWLKLSAPDKLTNSEVDYLSSAFIPLPVYFVPPIKCHLPIHEWWSINRLMKWAVLQTVSSVCSIIQPMHSGPTFITITAPFWTEILLTVQKLPFVCKILPSTHQISHKSCCGFSKIVKSLVYRNKNWKSPYVRQMIFQN